MPPPDYAPIAQQVDPRAQLIMTVVQFAVALGASWYLLHSRRGSELAFRILVIVSGSACAAVFEPAADRLVHLWYAAEGGQWRLITLFGIHVPLWQLGCYTWFVGCASLFAIDRLNAGGGARAMWQIYWAIAAIDVFIEVPLSHVVTLYHYFGDQQPFFSDIWRLPAWMIFVNGAMPLAAAAGALGVRALHHRPAWAMLPIVIPGSQFALYAAVSWPTIALINSNASKPTTYLIGTITIAIEVAVSGYTLCHLLPRLASAARQHQSPLTRPVQTPEPRPAPA